MRYHTEASCLLGAAIADVLPVFIAQFESTSTTLFYYAVINVA
jgi:hypothetical protein